MPSEDEGRTWRGYREIARDPRRNEPPPPTGDHGVSYTIPVLTKERKIIVPMPIASDGGYLLLHLDPEWLYETAQKADFSSGLDEWSTFGTRGPELLPHPEKDGARVLSLRKPDAEWPAA